MYKTLVVLFAVIFMVSLSTVRYFNYFYVKQSFEQDADQLLIQLHGSILNARKLLEELPEPDNFKCDENGQKLLDSLTFETPSIRWLGVYHKETDFCHSALVDLNFLNYREHELDKEFALASSKHGGGKSDFLLVRKVDGSRYFADLNPFIIDYLSGFDCLGCLKYQIILNGNPPLIFTSNDVANKYVVEHNFSRNEGELDASISIEGTQELSDYYSQLSWFSALLFALIFSILSTIVLTFLIHRRQSFERVVKDAIRFREFVPYYQPIVDSRTNELIGAEVLVRWIRADGSIVPPSQFIGFAEKSGLIIPITELLVRQVCADIVTFDWRESGKYASINIVPAHLESDDFYHLMDKAAKDNGIDLKNLAIEITERFEIKNLAKARVSIERFLKQGVKLKLDDAGTGYGGFSYVQELSISTLKIDKMFVDTILHKDDFKRPVLDAVISFAKSSNLDLIAEGVEEIEQVEYLQQRDVFYIQGYFYAKPMPAAELLKWINASTQKG